FRIELHRHNARGYVRYEHRNKERRDFSRTALAIYVVLLLETLQSANSTADDHTDTIGIHAVLFGESGVVHRLVCSTDCILRELICALGFFSLHVRERIEILYLAGKANGKVRSIEMRNGCRAGSPFEQC